MHFLAEYGLFLAKITTIVVAILVVLVAIMVLGCKNKSKEKGHLVIKKASDKWQNVEEALQKATLPKKDLKNWQKEQKKLLKAQEDRADKRVFVIHFHGDMRASQVEMLREEISAILLIATIKDEVVVNIESGGGVVHTYGLCASQLQRIRDKQIPLTVVIDKVAASGGYMMACVANRILCAPFAIIGSIGVLVQAPNFNRFLKHHNIDFEQLSAGEYKRTVSIFGENTQKGRKKLLEEIEVVHALFKNFITQHRPQVNIDQVATGEHWLGKTALDLKLVDAISTSDDYLMQISQSATVYEVSYHTKKSLTDKFALSAHVLVEKLTSGIWQKQRDSQLGGI